MSRRNDTTPVPTNGHSIKLIVSPETHEKLRQIGFAHNLVLTSLIRDLIDRAVADPKKYFPANFKKPPKPT